MVVSRIIGDWDIDWPTFRQKYGVGSLDELTLSPRHSVFGGGTADDLSASIDSDRAPAEFFVRPVPFGEIGPYVQDSDLVVYVYHQCAAAGLVDLLKQRGQHAEICYLDGAGVPHQTAPWGAKLQSRPIAKEEHPHRIMHVFRIRMPSASAEREQALK